MELTASKVAGGRQPDPELESELAESAARLEGAPAEEILRYAAERFGAGLVVATSFQDCVLVDLTVRVAPETPVVFIDTGFHFPETLAYLRRIERRYGIEVQVLSAGLDECSSPCGTARCCELRKVAPLSAFLAERSAWVSGVKRVDTPQRAAAPVIGWDPSRGLVKVNPLACWSEDDVEGYVESRRLPRHPLNAVGYLSIGCAPTTSPVSPDEDPRAGRWAGSGKTECGLHA